MGPLEPLAPDQRAVVALVLQQGRSYDEIAALLGIPVESVRGRAQAGLAALARNGLPSEITGPLADYLLGQQVERDAAATRGLLEESAPARAWATDVAAILGAVAPNGLPEIPGGEPAESAPAEAMPALRPRPVGEPAAPESAAPPAPRPVSEPAAPESAAPGASPPHPAPESAAPAAPRPHPVPEPAGPPTDARPAASRLGGALLIAGVVAAVAVVLFLVLRGGDDSGDEASGPSDTPAATATATATATAAPAQVADRIALRSAAGRARGTMTVYLQDGRLLFELVARNVPPNGANDAYAVWFTGPGGKFRRLGYTNPVGKDGRLGIQGPGENDLAAFPKLYATYARVVVSRETSQAAKRPAAVVLEGKLPQAR